MFPKKFDAIMYIFRKEKYTTLNAQVLDRTISASTELQVHLLNYFCTRLYEKSFFGYLLVVA